MPRNSQLIRFQTVIHLLEGAPQGLTVSEIEERLKNRDIPATKRTIYRDLEAIGAAGFPIFTEDGEDGQGQRFRLDRTTQVGQSLLLSPRDLVALYLAQKMLTPLQDTPFYEDLKSVFLKIEEKISPKGQEHLVELADEFRFEPHPRWGLGLDPDLLETVRASCAEGHVLGVEYDSVNSRTLRQRRLGPHYLYFAKGSLYLVAQDLEDPERRVKVFSVPRMKNAVMTDEAYDGKVILPEELFGDSFGLFRGGEKTVVEILFSPRAAPFVRERRWNASQRVVAKSDGSIVLKFELALTPDLTQWVLGFGPDAQVITPKALQDDLLCAAEQVVGNYRKKAA